MRCTACSADNPANARFCTQCGTKLGPGCPGCGAPLAPGARFCQACGRALEPAPAPASAATAPSDDSGERRYATVLFSDLSGYTALNERFDPEEVEAVMRRVKDAATAIIEANGGTVNQFVGDEIYALFGVPHARRDDPQRAVRAALELHRSVEGIGTELAGALGTRLALHTGINTGPVLVRRSEAHAGRFLLTGDTVNTGARLLKLAAPGEVVVGPATWREVSDAFEGHAGDAVRVKGKEAPLTPYRVARERAVVDASLRPLVGRAEEMRQFEALAQACLDAGRGRVIVLRGDPGIGKTRLAVEFLHAARGLGFSCHRALVLDFGAQTGRDAARSLVQSVLGVAAEADEAARRDAVGHAAAQGLVAKERALFLYDLADASPPAALRALHAAMNNTARQRGALDAIAELVRHASATRPLLLLVEDLHWADAGTLERLSAIANAVATSALLLVITTRFDGDPTVGPWRGALRGVPTSSIGLAPLGAEDAVALASVASGMPESIVRHCVERAEGNPLFLEQLLLNAEGAALESLPGTIQALVMSRMDRLEAQDRAALQAAAILGQRFPLDALRHVASDPSYECSVLVEHFLVRQEGGEYLFCHALIRDGVRESLLKARRKQLHARAAQWFEARDPVLAAEHFDRAESPRAPQAYLAAIRAESAQFRYDAALALAERGLAAAKDPAERFLLLSARAELLLETGHAAESIETSRAALEAAGEPLQRATALVAMAAAMRITDRVDEGLAALAEAQPLAEGPDAALLLSRLHHLRGNLFFPLGRIDECLNEHQQALARAIEAGSLEAEATALGGLGDAYYLGGRMLSSHRQFEKCAALCRAHGFGRIEVTVLHMVGWTACYLNDMQLAAEFGNQAADLAAKVSHPRPEILGRMLVGYVEGCIRGNHAAASEALERAVSLARSLGAKRFEAQALQFQASVAQAQGRRAQARALVDEALQICRQHGMGFTGPWLHAVLAGLLDDPAARARALAEGEALLAGGCVSHNHFHFHAQAIDVCLAESNWDAAERYCDRLENYAANEPLPWTRLVVRRGRALCRFGRGEHTEELQRSLAGLRDEAVAAHMSNLLPGLDTALGSG